MRCVVHGERVLCMWFVYMVWMFVCGVHNIAFRQFERGIHPFFGWRDWDVLCVVCIVHCTTMRCENGSYGLVMWCDVCVCLPYSCVCAWMRAIFSYMDCTTEHDGRTTMSIECLFAYKRQPAASDRGREWTGRSERFDDLTALIYCIYYITLRRHNIDDWEETFIWTCATSAYQILLVVIWWFLFWYPT